MHWLDEVKDEPAPPEPEPPSRRRPPRLPGHPEIPPMPVAASTVPATTNKTIEVEPAWLTLIEERRAKNAEEATETRRESAAQPGTEPKRATEAGRATEVGRATEAGRATGTKREAPAAAPRPPAPGARPRIRPIPREDE